MSRGRPFSALTAVMFGVAALAAQSRAQEVCNAPEPVCAARDAVFGVSAFDPVGSAVRIAPDLLVTNRHIVADQETIEIRLHNGEKTHGQVVPTAFLGDMVLIRSKLPQGPVLTPGSDYGGSLWTVGEDISAKSVKVYEGGKLLLAPYEGKPFARIHHTAYSQPGNSGGALVNGKGRLVGITASGGAGRYEAVPAGQIADLQAVSGPEYREKSESLGKNVRECTLMLEKAQRLGDRLPDKIAEVVKTSCAASGNRQLYDLTGQLLGRQRQLDDAVKFFEKSLEKDPNAINSRVGLVITLRFARRLDDAAEHVRWLLKVVPEERSIHPIALAVGKSSNDQALIDQTLMLIEKHAPNQLEAAKNYLKSPVAR
jgi:hypothetical protein